MGSNMGARTLIVMVLTVAIIGSCYGINCGKVVTVESKELLSYLASVNFPAPKSFNGQWNLEMKTDVPFTFLGVKTLTLPNIFNNSLMMIAYV